MAFEADCGVSTVLEKRALGDVLHVAPPAKVVRIFMFGNGWLGGKSEIRNPKSVPAFLIPNS